VKYRILTVNLFIFLAAFFLLGTIHPVYSLDFNVSPNKDGTMDVDLGLSWNYTKNFFSGVKGQYRNILEEDTGSDQFVSTSGTVLSLDTDILGFEISGSRYTKVKLSLNTQMQKMDIREIGYVDYEDTRFFILNDRTLNLFLPRLKGDLCFENKLMRFTMGGEYSPWLYVVLDQELTISPGLDKTSFSSSQSATNAYSINSKVRFINSMIIPEISAEYDYLAIKYDVYTAGGEATIDTLMQTLTTDFTLIFTIINLKGLHPTLTWEYEWDWTTDMVSDTSADLVTKSSIGVGFEF